MRYHVTMSRPGHGLRRRYVCALAILSSTVIVTYFCSHPNFTDYSTRNTFSSVLFDDRNDHRLSSNNLQLSSHSVIKQYPSTDTSDQTHGVQIEDSKVTKSGVSSAVHNLKTHASSGVCIKDNCLEYLSPAEKLTVNMCERESIMKNIGAKIEKGSCNFLSDRRRRAVALSSTEGSGNTWLRGLLEKATGICTGFCCCDTEMRAVGFVGEGIVSGKVLAVKTHVVYPQWIGQVKTIPWEGSYDSAIFLIRNPAKAVIAEWNRWMTYWNNWIMEQENNSHVNVLSKAMFLDKKWNGFSEDYLQLWIERLDNWVFNNHSHPVHVVSYEDLKRDTVGEVEKILDFLRFPYSHNDLVERLRQDYTVFQRPHTNDDFQHFSPEQKENLRTTLLTVMARAKACGKSDLFHFDEYLDSLSDIL